MITHFKPMRQIPAKDHYKKGDVMVVFGELFSRGYANGIVEEAQKAGMTIIFSTVGRRDENEKLRALTPQELIEKSQSIINVPLEAGFDLEPAKSGRRPVDQLQGLKLSEWNKGKINFDEIEQSRAAGIESFRQRVAEFMHELEKQIPPQSNILFVHTMAGGVPRAKIVMPAMNRVFKGAGDRYASSEEFWNTDMGRFCAASFEEVTGNTLHHLIDLSQGIRERSERAGNHVSYVAYGYHGTDVLVSGNYQWQSYAPYLQGFSKIQLENIAREAFSQGVKVSVFNAPEILTNSSSIFLGVEVSLYPLVGALQKEGGGNHAVEQILKDCGQLLNTDHKLDDIMSYTERYFKSEVIQKWSQFGLWPQHNGLEQMNQMRDASSFLIGLHKDPKYLMTSLLSEVVFRACGEIMLAESWSPREPVWWLGHDIIAKQSATQK
jgi:hypothetical protein